MSPVNDPIGDLLTRMRNAQKARHATCSAPWSRIKEELLTLLKNEQWIADVQVTGEDPHRTIEVTFSPDRPSITIKRESRPGRRMYSPASEIKHVLQGFGIAVPTTSKGLLTDKQARRQHVGGEVLCTLS